MAGMDGEPSRIHDVDRNSKILRDIPSKPYQKFGSFIQARDRLRHHLKHGYNQMGRDFPRTIAGGVSEGFLPCNYSVNEYNNCWVRKEVPIFRCTSHIEDFYEWVDVIEVYFAKENLSEELKCILVSYTLEGEAEIWWQQLQLNRMKEGKAKISCWSRMRALLFKYFMHIKCLTKCSSNVNSSSKVVNYGQNMPEDRVQRIEDRKEGMEHLLDDTLVPVKCLTEFQKQSNKPGKDEVVNAKTSTPTKCSTRLPKHEGEEGSTDVQFDYKIASKYEDSAPIATFTDGSGYEDILLEQPLHFQHLGQFMVHTKLGAEEPLEEQTYESNIETPAAGMPISINNNVQAVERVGPQHTYPVTTDDFRVGPQHTYPVKKEVSASKCMAQMQSILPIHLAGMGEALIASQDLVNHNYEKQHQVWKPMVMNKLNMVVSPFSNESLVLTYLFLGKCVDSIYSIAKHVSFLIDPGGVLCPIRARSTSLTSEISIDVETVHAMPRLNDWSFDMVIENILDLCGSLYKLVRLMRMNSELCASVLIKIEDVSGPYEMVYVGDLPCTRGGYTQTDEVLEAKMVQLAYVDPVWKIPWNVTIEDSLNDAIQQSSFDSVQAMNSVCPSIITMLTNRETRDLFETNFIGLALVRISYVDRWSDQATIWILALLIILPAIREYALPQLSKNHWNTDSPLGQLLGVFLFVWNESYTEDSVSDDKVASVIVTSTFMKQWKGKAGSIVRSKEQLDSSYTFPEDLLNVLGSLIPMKVLQSQACTQIADWPMHFLYIEHAFAGVYFEDFVAISNYLNLTSVHPYIPTISTSLLQYSTFVGMVNVLNLIEKKVPWDLLYTPKRLKVSGEVLIMARSSSNSIILGQFLANFTAIFEEYTSGLQLLIGISLWGLAWMHSVPYCSLRVIFPSCGAYNNNLTRGRAISWEGRNDEHNLCENGQLMETLKLFYKVVNGLDPPKGSNSGVGSFKHPVMHQQKRTTRGRVYYFGEGMEMMQCDTSSFWLILS